MQQHITILGALYLGLSALGVLAAIIVFVSAAGGGLLSGNAEAAGIAAGAGGIIAIIILIVSYPVCLQATDCLRASRGRASWRLCLAQSTCSISRLGLSSAYIPCGQCSSRKRSRC